MSEKKLEENFLNPIVGVFRKYVVGALVGVASIAGCSGSSNTAGKVDAVNYNPSGWGGDFSSADTYTPDTNSSLEEIKSGNQWCYKDNDGDKEGSTKSGQALLETCPNGWSTKNGDCDDNNPSILYNCPQPNADVSVGIDTLPDTLKDKYIIEIASGGNHACAHLSTNEVYCWGLNHKGQVGNGTNFDSYSPTKVIELEGIVIKQLVAGYNHTCARTDEGRVLCWGDYSADGATHSIPTIIGGELEGKFVTQMAAGDAHNLAVVGNQTLYAWGSGGHGNLCMGETANPKDGHYPDHDTPTKTVSLEDDIKQVAAGAGVSFIVLYNGKALSCGRDSSGLLGDGDTNNSSTNVPVQIKIPEVETIVQIAAGYGHGVALAESGTVYFWGDNTKYQSGLGKGSENYYTAPIPVGDIGGVVSHLTCGDEHTCAAFTDGQIKCFGSNPFGQVAQDPTVVHEVYSAKDAPFLYVKSNLKVIQIEAGRMFTGAVTENGTTLFWGKNEDGPLGDGTTQDHWEPKEVKFE